jgi:cell division protein FtsZ
LGYGASRAPKKPVLPLPTEAELAEDAGASAPGQPARFEDEDEDEGVYDAGAAESYAAPSLPASYDVTMGEEEEGEEGEEGEEEDEEDGLAEPADDSQFGAGNEGGYASLGAMRIDRVPGEDTGADEWEDAGEGEDPAGDDAFELTTEAGQEPPAAPSPEQDELLLDASRLVEADEPVQPGMGGRRKRMLGSGGEQDDAAAPAPRGGASGGSTLFERMANLSRANPGTSDDDDDEEEGGGSLRIPRFLGRQNNQ